jgi:HAD superfamily hydrolase (TIGR01509 family)
MKDTAKYRQGLLRFMTNRLENPLSRRLACSGCGTAFTCDLSGTCWCAEETARLPMPAEGGDCLCRECLRKAADIWNIDAVLIDMDGTLLDTERVYLASLTTALTAFGHGADAEAMCHAMIGIPGPECENMLRVRYGDDFPLPDFNRAFVARRDEILAEGLPVKRGTVELLDALRAADCPIAIVTSSSRRTADQHLTLGGIRSYFETILTRDDVERGKPSPDLYLLAAATLGVRPQACIAIEDSNPGIAAAHAAGTIPIMVPDILQPTADTRAKCAAVLPDLHAALAMLKTRGRLGNKSSF